MSITPQTIAADHLARYTRFIKAVDELHASLMREENGQPEDRNQTHAIQSEYDIAHAAVICTTDWHHHRSQLADDFDHLKLRSFCETMITTPA